MILAERMQAQNKGIVFERARNDSAYSPMTSRWSIKDFQFFHSDGGPGSGNFGHKGREGEVGGSAPSGMSRSAVQGKDISSSYTGKKDIKSVVKAQGFDGLPKVVSKKEFDESVKQSKFIAQRSYSASSQEILDEYRNQLYNGEWYVECSVGGAQYGQGMYCAADYNGELTDGIKKEMEHYKKVSSDRFIGPAKTIASVLGIPYDEYVKQHGVGNSYVETFTMSPDAKIIKYREIPELRKQVIDSVRKGTCERLIKEVDESDTLTDMEKAYIKDRGFELPVSAETHAETVKWFKGLSKQEKDSVHEKYSPIVAEYRRPSEAIDAIKEMDDGALAALAGYDAINAEGHGLSGSYTVILNRTKVIFLKDDEKREDSKDDKIVFQIGPDGVIYAIKNRKVIGWVSAMESEVDASDEESRSDSEFFEGELTSKKEEKDVLYPDRKHKDGGKGSGNFGHKGIKGQIGGSAPSVVRTFDSSKVKPQIKVFWRDQPDKKEIDNLLSMVGANEIDPTSEDDLSLEFNKNGRYNVEIDSKSKGIYLACEIYTKYKPSMHISYLVLKETGRGKGADIFESIAYNAKANGLESIELNAAGSPEDKEYNGYYTWPRLGFDGELYLTQRKKAQKDGFDVKRVSELMATPEGRKWWKKNGSDIDLTFELSDDSYSMKTLRDYLDSRNDDDSFDFDELLFDSVQKMEDYQKNKEFDGGQGSGNFGHEGRPGEIGGSAPSGARCNPSIKGVKSSLSKKENEDLTKKVQDKIKQRISIQKSMDDYVKEHNPRKPGYDPKPYIQYEAEIKEIEKELKKIEPDLKIGTIFATGTLIYEKTGEKEWKRTNGTNSITVSSSLAANELSGVYNVTESHLPIFIDNADDVIQQKSYTSKSDETLEGYANDLNTTTKKDLVKKAKKDKDFKELVDTIVLYTEGGYAEQRKGVEDAIANGMDNVDAMTIGEFADGNLYEFRDLWKEQNLKESDSGLVSGMLTLTETINHAKPCEDTLYRATSDRSIIKTDGQHAYKPPEVGDVITIDAPTSFTADFDVEKDIIGGKMGDRIHYILEPGAKAVDVSQLSRYKQAEFLSCGKFEVVSCESRPYFHGTIRDESQITPAIRERGIKENPWGEKYYDLYETTVRIRHVGDVDIRSQHNDSAELVYDHFDDDVPRKKKEDGGPGSGNFGHKGVKGQVGGSAPSDSSSPAKSAKKSKKDFLPATSYTDTPAFKKASQTAKEAYKKKDDSWERIKQIDEELKHESEPKPQKDWDDNDFLDYLLGRKPKILTEKGKKLTEERKTVWSEMTQAEDEFTTAGDKMRDMKSDAHKREIKNFHPEPLTPAKSEDYEGFTLEETSNSYGDEYLHNGKGVICEMTPKEYLERCAFEIFENATIESCVAAIDEEAAQKYAQQMREGTKFHLPYLNYAQDGQEGRHRAYAAYLAGIEKIPVLIIGRPKRNDGGPGSGNFGHKGRPGEIGGSAPDDGADTKPSKNNEQRARESLLSMTKRKANDQIVKIAERDDEYDKKRDEVVKILNELPIGSKVKTPDFWNDNGVGDVLVWGGQWWSTKKSWDNGGWSTTPEELADYFLSDDPTNRPLVTSVASTPEEMKKWNEEQEKKYWRNQESIWKKGGGLKETTTIKLRKFEIDHCGDGFEVKGTDGRTYIKYDGEWVDKETYREADKRKIKSPEITGDFFEINFGMNGVSAEECHKMRETWDRFNPQMKAKYEEAFRKGEFLPALQGKISHYSTSTGAIHFDRDSDAETIIHEMSHKLDDGGLIDKTNSAGYHVDKPSIWMDHILGQTDIRSDFESVASVLGFESDGDHWFKGWSDNDDENYEIKSKAMEKYLKFWSKYHDIPGFGAVADAISGQTQNQIKTTIVGGGHEEDYWLQYHSIHRASSQSTEYWAEFCVCKACGYDKALDLLKKITPNMYSAAEEIWEEVFNGKAE